MPLTQTFIGVSKTAVPERNALMLQIAYDKALAAIQRGKQVMIFVHARNETVRTDASTDAGFSSPPPSPPPEGGGDIETGGGGGGPDAPAASQPEERPKSGSSTKSRSSKWKRSRG